MPMLCNEHEESALLQFKQSMLVNMSSCDKARILSWDKNKQVNCCFWEGVSCDLENDHIIGLDLRNSCLVGTINSSNGIYDLVHLRWLDLAGNDFLYSQISPRLHNLSMLARVNLSYSSFYGDVPKEIFKLSQLESLDLSGNVLSLRPDAMRSISPNVSILSVLHLSEVHMSVEALDVFANLSSLTSLRLENCDLQGQCPDSIFFHPNLETLDLMSNQDLNGRLPEFLSGSPLKTLLLASTNFGGKVPDSLGKLSSLKTIDLGDCGFTGSIPSRIGNLTKLTMLRLAHNRFQGPIPSLGRLTQLRNLSLAYNNFAPSGALHWLGKLTQLTNLYLAGTNLHGQVPVSIANLTKLRILHLNYNQLTGDIPPWMGDLRHIARLGLAGNKLEGSIPSWIFQLKSLEYLHLSSNNFTGTVEFDMFQELENLSRLQLSDNHISVNTNTSTNFALPKLQLLALDSCSITEFPDFLRTQETLKVLSLSCNNISGHIPNWVFSISKETMLFVNFSHNFLTGFDQSSVVPSWHRAKVLDLSCNMLSGSIPPPPPSAYFYSISTNKLYGEIPASVCNAVNLQVLDLSNNLLSGGIPLCLSNFSSSLTILNLKGNEFSGTIPQMFRGACKLRSIDMSKNMFQGQIPSTWANCSLLERLDMGTNQILGTFPSWLGTLPALQVLILRSNRFYGAVGRPASKNEFPSLRIIDLSNNLFTGELPSEYFANWKAMSIRNFTTQLAYLQVVSDWNVYFANAAWSGFYNYSMTMTMKNKGTERVYQKISNILTAIDLSGNKFTGEIPESIGCLKALTVLDLSSNDLVGDIPSAIADLQQLESLDLSHNMLSGEIPPQLNDLNFLSYLNLSYNQLTGTIPGGQQFNTFDSSSFIGNPGLCGPPLPNTCEDPAVDNQVEEESLIDRLWVPVWTGYGTGMATGLAFGITMTIRKHELFMKIYRMVQRKRT